MEPRDRPRRTRPLYGAQTIPLTSPLRAMPIFRPAPYLAVIAILLPTAAVIIATAILLNQNQQPPLWVPLVILASIPILTLVWLFMRSVRLSPVGISVGRPFQRWREAAWHEIIRAERHGMFIRIYTDRGAYISFAPRLLGDGRQLHKIVLNHLRPQILDGALRKEALDQMPVPESDLTGTLRARPRIRWPFSGFLLALAGAAGAAISLMQLPEPLAGALCLLGIMVALLGLSLAVWLLQEVIVTTEGLTIIRPWRRSPDEVMWSDVRVLDHSQHWALLRFRVGHSVRCIGPTLLREPERELMFAFINRYCLQHGVLKYPHRGLF